MALSIKSDEADRLARQLVLETGESLTQAVVTALRERLERQHAHRQPTITTRLRRLQAEAAALPVLDAHTPEEIIGYDHRGLPE